MPIDVMAYFNDNAWYRVDCFYGFEGNYTSVLCPHLEKEMKEKDLTEYIMNEINPTKIGFERVALVIS